MVIASLATQEDYWDDFQLLEDDIDFLYSYLLEIETPLTPQEIIKVLVEDRLERERKKIELKRISGGDLYLPKDEYQLEQTLVFPELNWRQAVVINLRPGKNPDLGEFTVMQVRFENNEEREFASGLASHILNEPPAGADEEAPEGELVIASHGNTLAAGLEHGLLENSDFVRIAGRWFPRALLININDGHLNLAEALLDIAGGGPLPTSELLEQLDLPINDNPKLVEFSLDLALQEDDRFDEIGPAGQVLWFLKRLEPDGVSEIPIYLQYEKIEYDQSELTPDMLALENQLDDELSESITVSSEKTKDVAVSLLFPHWRAGTLPLTPQVKPFFPTAYLTSRIRFMLVDGASGKKFPGWVVRNGGYIFGLDQWYRQHGLMPGSIVRIKHGKEAGEVIISVDSKRSRRDWVRTVLVGADGGVVFATLKQLVAAGYDERMGIYVPELESLDQVWQKNLLNKHPFERTVAKVARELTKLNPQGHVHITELYAAINLVQRCPPGQLMALLTSRPWYVHVGDLHYRFDDSAN
ncbi:MAG: hypothetical protein IZT55_01990 [Anaerolineae bacterium]|nr:hypothetical protein [Anaerolineae bacterium]